MLTAAQVHLAMLHFPIAGMIFGLIFLTWGLLRASKGAREAGLVLFFLSGLCSVPVFLSGEGAEEIVEDKPNVTEVLIETHEEAAEMAFYVTLVAAGMALLSFVLKRKEMKVAQISMLATLLVGVLSAGLLARAAHLGGMIRHDELRSDSATTNPD